MSEFSKGSFQIFMLLMLCCMGTALNPVVALAQGGNKGITVATPQPVINAPQPDPKSLQSANEIIPDVAETAGERKPVPVLETGDYSFDDDGQPPAKPDPSLPSIEQPPISESDIAGDAFYDTEAIVPKGKVGREGPAPVDPKKQPASKLVIVESVLPQSDKSTQLVAAQRAMALGRYDSALTLYDDLYTKNKKDSSVLMGRAVCLQKLGRYDEAMQTYEDLALLEPKNVEVKINMLGLLATRYPAIALRRLMDLHDTNQENVGIVAQIAVTAANLGDSDTAMRYLGIAMGMQPNNASHIFNAAVILDRAGKTKDAVSYYEKALEVDSIYGSGRSIPRAVVYERLAHIR